MSSEALLSRRQLLAGLAAITLSPVLPFRANAEPMTVLAAGAAVVSIIGGVAGIISDSKKEALLREISGKLDAVIRNQAIIIAEIQALKMYIDEALYRAFRENTIVRMNAHQDRYEVLASEKPTGRNRDEYLDLQTAVSQTSFELGQFDTPAYIAYGAGVGMTLAIHQALGLSNERFKKLKEVFTRPYDRWLDPSNAASIIAIIGRTQGEIGLRKTALEARPRSISSSRRRGRCEYTTTITITGDFQSGYSGTVSEKMGECLEPHDPCARLKCPVAIGSDWLAAVDDVDRRLASVVAGTEVAASAEPPIPRFAASGIGVVDEMNLERNAIYELMNLLARQQVVQEQMEKCRNALAT